MRKGPEPTGPEGGKLALIVRDMIRSVLEKKSSEGGVRLEKAGPRKEGGESQVPPPPKKRVEAPRRYGSGRTSKHTTELIVESLTGLTKQFCRKGIRERA